MLRCRGSGIVVLGLSLLLYIHISPEGNGAGRASAGAVPQLKPQNVTGAFWEPLPFATLPVTLSTNAVFYQDETVQGKVLTIGGNTGLASTNYSATVNWVYEMDVG